MKSGQKILPESNQLLDFTPSLKGMWRTENKKDSEIKGNNCQMENVQFYETIIQTSNMIKKKR